MKKVFILAMTIIFIGCNIDQGIIDQEIEPEWYEWYDWEIEVAKMFFYSPTIAEMTGQDEPNNVYVGENELEGQCGDYALMMAILYGVDIIVQNQKTDYFPDGIYRLIGELKDTPAHLLDWVKKNIYVSGLVYYFYYDNATHFETSCLYHQDLGFYVIELIEAKTFATDIAGNKLRMGHVWNIYDDIQLDATFIDGGWKR